MSTVLGNESVVKISLDDESNLFEVLDLPDSRTNFIHVRHGSEKDPNLNLTQIARKDGAARELVVGLARRGFYTYMASDNTTRLVRERRLDALWNPLKNGEYTQTSDGLIFTLTPPKTATFGPKLLVIFSSMHPTIYTSSLIRYFTQNFGSIQKYVAPETAILRIADVGGIVGSFYLNTVNHPDNTGRIQRLIRHTAHQLGVEQRDIVLYGASKGGTGALFHGLAGGFKSVSVDPVIADTHYVENFNDSHFTQDTVFTKTKEEVFQALISAQSPDLGFGEVESRSVVVYSRRSPQHKFIEPMLLEPLGHGMAFFNVEHPDIEDHPDVAPMSLPITTTCLNSLLYREDVPPGLRTVV